MSEIIDKKIVEEVETASEKKKAKELTASEQTELNREAGSCIRLVAVTISIGLIIFAVGIFFILRATVFKPEEPVTPVDVEYVGENPVVSVQIPNFEVQKTGIYLDGLDITNTDVSDKTVKVRVTYKNGETIEKNAYIVKASATENDYEYVDIDNKVGKIIIKIAESTKPIK